MEKPNDLVPIEINLNPTEADMLNESWLAMMGGAIQTILTGMFGGKTIPVRISGTRKQVDSFKSALGNEARYLKAMKRYGLDKPETLKTKAQLDRAIKNFERDTGISWPFK
jgi:hypothetical protein|tara:strand:+ start:200 stop:532 length:333 start_codon:yes stop_codon:yes gene_type:complete